ncbi:hypothetical protein QYE76_054176 [Lolium multiflorum]|uniref:Uncharacterized protein n=1 Tax=Lolium multiflorum TaxID=4521 RepID=A0AAD8SY43_LOLMU|nr:hypothetical protein QYE76_054176 [Lolium multiflorum]
MKELAKSSLQMVCIPSTLSLSAPASLQGLECSTLFYEGVWSAHLTFFFVLPVFAAFYMLCSLGHALGVSRSYYASSHGQHQKAIVDAKFRTSEVKVYRTFIQDSDLIAFCGIYPETEMVIREVEPIWKGATELIICLTHARMHNVIVVQFSDGYMDAVIIRDFPKADLIAFLLKVSDGSYVKSTYDLGFNSVAGKL